MGGGGGGVAWEEEIGRGRTGGGASRASENDEIETDCGSVCSCDTDLASHSPSESSLLSSDSSSAELGAMRGEMSVYAAAATASVGSKHRRRDSVAYTRVLWGGLCKPAEEGRGDDGEDEDDDSSVDAMFVYDRCGLAPQSELTNKLARFLLVTNLA